MTYNPRLEELEAELCRELCRKVDADDPRLCDAREPIYHEHPAEEIKGLKEVVAKEIESVTIVAEAEIEVEAEENTPSDGMDV